MLGVVLVQNPQWWDWRGLACVKSTLLNGAQWTHRGVQLRPLPVWWAHHLLISLHYMWVCICICICVCVCLCLWFAFSSLYLPLSLYFSFCCLCICIWIQRGLQPTLRHFLNFYYFPLILYYTTMCHILWFPNKKEEETSSNLSVWAVIKLWKTCDYCRTKVSHFNFFSN